MAVSLSSDGVSYTKEIAPSKHELDEFKSRVLCSLRYGKKAVKYYDQDKIEKLWAMLSKEDRAHIQSMNRIYKIGSTGKFILMPNTDPQSGGCGGHMVELHAEAPVVSALILNNDAPFANTMMCRVINDHKIDAARLKERAKTNLKEMLSVFHASLPTRDHYPSIERHFDAKNPGTDKAAWLPFLYGKDSRVGVYQTSVNGVDMIFLVCNSCAGPKIAKELNDLTKDMSMTAGDFARDERIKWARRLGKRNCQRLLKLSADRLGVKIDTEADLSSFRGQYEKVSPMASPNVVTSYNTFDLIKPRHKGEGTSEKVAFFNDCASGKQSKMSSLIISDRIEPIVEKQSLSSIERNRTNDAFSQSVHSSHENSHLSIENAIGNAIPSHTSSLSDEEVQRKRRTISLRMKKKIQTKIVDTRSDDTKSIDGSSPSSSSEVAKLQSLINESYGVRKTQFEEGTVPGVMSSSSFGGTAVRSMSGEIPSSLYGLSDKDEMTREYHPLVVLF